MSSINLSWTADITAATETAPCILIVDDEHSILRVLRRTLVREGYRVLLADSAESAADLLGETPVDVIVTDIRLGAADGLELLRRAHARDPDLPVIMITGAPQVETAIRAIEHGAFRYMTKPFDVEEIRRVVSQAASTYRANLDKREVISKKNADDDARKTLACELGRAVDALFLAYQPIVSWSRRSVTAYEALLRTKHAALPNPGVILDAAEKLGTLQDLGRTIRTAALGDAHRNPAGCVYINLHATDLLDPSLYDTASPLAQIAGRVVFEITERSAIHKIRDIRTRAADLRRMGFRLAIDDLGEGYAGLSSLSLVEPEVIKLDMSIVRGIEHSRTNQRVVRSMIAYAREASAELVAEGVETTAERDALVDLGCDIFQGYLFARPGAEFPAPKW